MSLFQYDPSAEDGEIPIQLTKEAKKEDWRRKREAMPLVYVYSNDEDVVSLTPAFMQSGTIEIGVCLSEIDGPCHVGHVAGQFFDIARRKADMPALIDKLNTLIDSWYKI